MASVYLKMLELSTFCTCQTAARLLVSTNVRSRSGDGAKATDFTAPAEATKMVVNQQHLKQAWDTSAVSTREDWNEWMQRLCVEFMKESPSHALRACMSLVDVHTPLAKELFNAAFLSCWGELYDQYQVRQMFVCVACV